MKVHNEIKNVCQCAGNSPRLRVRAQQSNHGDYHLPPCLSHLPAMPLYLAVAHLGMQMRAPLSRQEIAQAFSLESRRALEVMRYLVNGKVCVTCKRVPLAEGEFGKGYRIHIDAIGVPKKSFAGMRKDVSENSDSSLVEPSSMPRGKKRRAQKRTRSSDELAHQTLRRWFLQRPNINER